MPFLLPRSPRRLPPLLAAALALATAAGCQPAVAPSAGPATTVAHAPDPSDPVALPRPATKTGDGGIPADFHGRYASDAAGCAGADDLAMTIRADGIDFHESIGTATRVAVEDDVLDVGLRMTGEGETWDRDYRFRRESDGALQDLGDGGARRQRCGG